ncbi:hypothetical protein GN157_07215 [Flavobacterium rakeshii]|uniref:Outer membrane beta-barrel protein n=1 Tax=Flavobacterium rakeshii TaxID=1038845 RepID=A0A6N8HD15_9FLAO|nr:hypothetical protein [Flavobacterium rakeshii]MEE1899659.1 hypothetical protein [Flavobacterium rakeshii]MUV03495.1 hypothetical protein [Flavobacterium rakeshii]
MKKVMFLKILLLTFYATAQVEVVKDTVYERFFGEAGLRIPIGNGNRYGVSPEFGLWYRTKRANEVYDIGFSLFTPLNREVFIYKLNNREYSVKLQEVSGMVGVRMNKLYVMRNQNFALEWESSLGYAFLLYNAPREEGIDENFQNGDMVTGYSKGFSAFHLGQGVRFWYKNTGFQVKYNFTPYKLFTNYVPSGLGSHSLSLGFIYRQ